MYMYIGQEKGSDTGLSDQHTWVGGQHTKHTHKARLVGALHDQGRDQPIRAPRGREGDRQTDMDGWCTCTCEIGILRASSLWPLTCCLGGGREKGKKCSVNKQHTRMY